LERTVLVYCGKGRDEVLLESCDGAFGRVYSVIVGRYKVDVHFVAPDVGFDCLGALVVHDIERRRVSSGVEGREDVGKGGNHRSIVLGGHGADKDSIEVINIGHKYVLHVAK
jgi:hypothetical protein